MPEELKEEVKEPQDKKSVFGKIKDKILPDQDEQAAIILSLIHI